ncbi:MAG TPA: hypothetical protein VNL14_13955 [Candidatus Acidoferrales bacterium]|nr:hypothetical protein [Candidatus Acidoferrales bacterium]
MSKLDLDKIRDLIRTEEDAEILQEKLRAMIEEAHPVPAFTDGEVMPLYQFEARFKKAFCCGNETRFAQWPVRVNVDGEGRLSLHFERKDPEE